MIIPKQGMDMREFAMLDIRLKRILKLYESLAWWIYLDDTVITSIYRQDTSTHRNRKPYRFADVAILERGGVAGSRKIASILNLAFPRTDGRLTALVHGGSALHTHLQVRPV